MDEEFLHEPKMSVVEVFFLLVYVGIADLIGLIIVFFGADDFWILDALTAPINYYFYRKGVNTNAYNVVTITELIPYVGALPLKFFGVLAVVWADRHPESAVAKVAEKAGKAAAIAKAAKGKFAQPEEVAKKAAELKPAS
jgi:hypothetical protein